MIAETAIIHPNVEFGENIIIEDYCIIGSPFQGYRGEKTVIGNNALIRSGTVIYAGNKIGNNFQTGNKANIRELNIIGDNVGIGTLSVIEHHVEVSNNVRIHSQVFVPEFSILEDACWLGPNVVLTNARFPKHPNIKKELRGVRICTNAKVGANSTLLPGVCLGANCLVGAGSVVTKDVPENIIVAGNPAILLREIPY
ncbi:DapH/DapD/GlmU-related protein [uncultured Desulfosarcina sp.]|uniref:acyltransferase n=1 Tax=uncultured Desulfosarcina sp. TaxID=218289 RepID=UPI0029C88186|nr:DapH/DapD/GlmU-related protein [uncultured Desulfosarcina sp.]